MSDKAIVHCRYPKCLKLHPTNELAKIDAVKGGSKGNSYYHPDCYHTMQTVNKIRDLFLEKIDPTLTKSQIGMLVSTIHNIIFEKKVDVDYLEFAIKYFIHNKPGALKHPAGLHYIIQDRDASAAWERLRKQKIREEIKEQRKNILITDEFILDSPESSFTFKPQKPRSFEDILR